MQLTTSGAPPRSLSPRTSLAGDSRQGRFNQNATFAETPATRWNHICGPTRSCHTSARVLMLAAPSAPSRAARSASRNRPIVVGRGLGAPSSGWRRSHPIRGGARRKSAEPQGGSASKHTVTAADSMFPLPAGREERAASTRCQRWLSRSGRARGTAREPHMGCWLTPLLAPRRR